MNVSIEFLEYNALAICAYNPQTSVTISCSIQPTSVITMAMTVLHHTCNMFVRDLPDMNALIPWSQSLPGIFICMYICIRLLLSLKNFQVLCNFEQLT